MAAMTLVTTRIDEHVATITLNRTDRLNSLNEEMITALNQALHDAADKVRVIVLRAEPGVKVFCAGHDITEVPVGAPATVWDNPVETLLTAIPKLPVPVIAAVEGSVWGAGTNLVVACDLIVATQRSTFAITPAKLGVPYFSAGLSMFARSLPLHVVKHMFFTASPLAAEDAHRYGLVHTVVADEAELTEAATQLAARIAALAPLTIRSVKLELAALDPLSEVAAQQTAALREKAWHSADVHEGVQAFHERRSPGFLGE
jgi:methylmalonyl-CoA decarboxylase